MMYLIKTFGKFIKVWWYQKIKDFCRLYCLLYFYILLNRRYKYQTSLFSSIHPKTFVTIVKANSGDQVWHQTSIITAHPTHKSYRTDLQIVVGNGAVGRYSIGLGDETDARTFGVDENISSGLDDLTYDSSTGAFIENSDNQDFLHRSSSPRQDTLHVPFQYMSSEVPPTNKKRNRTEPEGKSSSLETNSSQSDVVDKLSHTIDKLTILLIHLLLEIAVGMLSRRFQT
ncbi:hypothetical protein FNV43_RR04652 [Rhamnella rubrinervis]|uniref:Uncharacterized protein n=1 Tax=Rhamnella rubrinervis TaxID=2594499 RepID=A0A8K0MQT5_9ROSA|nr:hypothetical protein FNV43_RR04652 [Rhamnella rubrinervis]